ncbi:MAG: 2-hydroxycarboxylate transporter family protein [Clostridium sp.]
MKNTIEKEGYRILGLPIIGFAIIATVVLVATYMGSLPTGMIGAFSLMIVLGAIFNEIGDITAIVNTFLGGGPIVIIFATAALVMYNIIPEAATENMTTFMKTGGFLDFYIAALITGSILGMSRKLLIKSAVRYLPVIICGLVVSLGLVALVGSLIGYGAQKAIFFIGIPIMGGGMGAGAVPLAKIFGESMGIDPVNMLSVMVPAVALGNAMAIVMGGLLDRLGKSKPKLTGNGKLMVIEGKDDVIEDDETNKLDIKAMGMGLLISLTFFVIGSTIGKLIPGIHSYAWMIMSVAAVKMIGIIPRFMELAAKQWYTFVMTNFTGALLVGIGVAYTDLAQVAAAFSWQYVVLVLAVIIGATIGAFFGGKFVGFYPIEAAITGGLCMANMGGTGDVAVLTAAKRMDLMPFSQISSRIGGAMVLILASALLKLFM